MRLILLLLLLQIFVQNVLEGQDKKSFKNKFLEAEYFFLRGDFDEARFIYSELLKESPDNSNLKFLIGACYLSNYREKLKAIPYLRDAVTNVSAGYREGSYKETSAPRESLFALAKAYHIAKDFTQAEEYYEKYRNVMKMGDVAEIDYIYKQIEACKLAGNMIKKPVSFRREELPDVVNGFRSCYNPVFSSRDSVLIFMADKTFYSAIMMSRFQSGSWSVPLVINDQLGADDKCYICSISPGGDQIFLSQKEKDGSFDLYTSFFRKGKWSKMKKLNKEINTPFDETHAIISPDGKFLYFTSNRPDGQGAMDIYRSAKDPKGDWDKPANLGEPVNTVYSEETPFFSEDGKIMFFSSMGHATIGGFDIFYSNLLPDGAWSYPANLGYPLNTCDDDLFFYPLADGKTALYSGFIGQQEGPRRISLVSLDTATTSPTIALKGQISLQDNLKELGQSFSVSITGSEKKDTVLSLSPDPKTGEFTAELNPGHYQVSMKGEGYTTKTENISVIKGLSQQEIKLESRLTPAAVTSGEYLVIKNVLYDFNSAKLSSEAQFELEKLYKAMVLHPEIYIQVTGHADAMGRDDYNLDLSVRRARSVVDYLVSRGISKERFISRGVGERENIAINVNPDGSDNPEGRKLNRYAEIKLINNSDARITIREIQVPENLKPRTGQKYSVLIRESESKIPDIPGNIGKETIKMIAADKGYLYLSGDFTSKAGAVIFLNKIIDQGYPEAKILSSPEIGELINSLSDTTESAKGPFTIQLMALRNSVDLSFFKGFNNVNQYISDDNLNRYTTGIYDTKEKALPDLRHMISLGFTDAFIMDLSRFQKNTGIKNNSASTEEFYFTIQFSATRKPADKKKFSHMENIRISMGDDGFYQYSSGLFSTRFLAEKELEKIRSKGYPDAFIKKIYR